MSSTAEMKRGCNLNLREKCGTEIQEGASFCPQCGFSVSVGQIGPVYVPQTAQPRETIPAISQSPVTQGRPVYAGFWLRAAAYLIDTILVSAVFGLVASFYPSKFLKFPDANAVSLRLALPQLTPLAIGLTILGLVALLCVFRDFLLAGHAGQKSAEASRYRPEGAAHHICACDLAAFCKDDFRTDVPGGILPCRIHREKTSASRHTCQLPRLEAAIGRLTGSFSSILRFGFLR